MLRLRSIAVALWLSGVSSFNEGDGRITVTSATTLGLVVRNVVGDGLGIEVHSFYITIPTP